MIKQKFIVYIFIFGLLLPFFSYASSGVVLSAYKYAWSDQIGYINFAPANGGVTVTDTALSGYAWSENTGYINFAPANGGVFNDGTGNLSGSAWGEGVGYIDFGGVTIDPAVGNTRKFSGTATGALVGTLTFDCGFCDVRTDWQPDSSTTGSSSGSRPSVSGSIIEVGDTYIPKGAVSSPGTIVSEELGSLGASVGSSFDNFFPPLGQNNIPIPMTALPALVGVSIALLGLLTMRLFVIFAPSSLRVAYYNATNSAELSGIAEKIIKKEFSHFKTVVLSNASTTNHKGNIVIDLSGNHSREAAKIAKLLNGRVESLPEGEIKPDADILVISGY